MPNFTSGQYIEQVELMLSFSQPEMAEHVTITCHTTWHVRISSSSTTWVSNSDSFWIYCLLIRSISIYLTFDTRIMVSALGTRAGATALFVYAIMPRSMNRRIPPLICLSAQRFPQNLFILNDLLLSTYAQNKLPFHRSCCDLQCGSIAHWHVWTNMWLCELQSSRPLIFPRTCKAFKIALYADFIRSLAENLARSTELWLYKSRQIHKTTSNEQYRATNLILTKAKVELNTRVWIRGSEARVLRA